MLSVDNPVELRAGQPIDVARLSAYLRSKIPGLAASDIEILQFPSGHSNLTYMIKSGERELILKREPPGAKAKSAHDMGREFRILSSLYGRYPFAPQPFDYCEDASIIGGKFCVMERLKGVIVRGEYPADGSVTPIQVQTQFSRLIEALAQLHSLDVAAVGLADFGRPQGYRQRQVEGWKKRLDDAKTENMADFSAVTSWLTRHMPTEPEQTAVVHNDFKMDNLVWSTDDIAKLIGVLDWEMSTVGDPLMDLACTLSFWVEKTDPPEFRALRAMPGARPDVLSRREAIRYYGMQTGRRIAATDFYLCFGLFRRAVIEQQKYFRYSRGQTQDPRFSKLDEAVRVLRDMCMKVIEDASKTGKQ